MTEIPEHLLKRSRERRAALGLGGGDAAASSDEGGEAAAPAATPAATGDATPAAAPPSGPPARRPPAPPAEAPPPKPDPPYVVAAKTRAKIPFWAMAALSLMPIWVFMYVRSLTAEPESVEGPLGVGAAVYGNCSSCHGVNGGGNQEGGTGQPFWNGEVNMTFPNIEDQLRFVYFGTTEYNAAGISSYGDPNREGGARSPGTLGEMPPQSVNTGGSLTDAEILGVVCHERYSFNGPDPTQDEEVAEEFEAWCSPESPIFASVEAGTTLAELSDAGIVDAEGNEIEILPIGDAPAEGKPKE